MLLVIENLNWWIGRKLTVLLELNGIAFLGFSAPTLLSD